MEIVTDRTEYEILSILDRKNRTVTSAEIEKELQKIGIEVTRRRIIQYLDAIDEKGLTENLGRDGRRITEVGQAEVENALVQCKLDYIPYKTIKLANEMTFDVDKGKGSVIVNISIFDENKEAEVRSTLKEICTKTNWSPPFIKIVPSNKELCDYRIPEGKKGLATISSITIDGVLTNKKIHTMSSYCGIVEFKNLKPVRFTSLAPTKGCSFDPLRIFMGQGKSTVINAVREKHGLVPADYREYLNILREDVTDKLKTTVNTLGGLIVVGRPCIPVLGIMPTENYGGISALGGELLISAIGEAGIQMDTTTVYSTLDFAELEQITEEVKGELLML